MEKQVMLRTLLSIFLIFPFLVSCEESEYEKIVEQDDVRIRTYLEENNINATKDQSGIYYEVLSENASGEPVEVNKVVSLFYKMSTLDGSLVDSNMGSLNPVMFGHDYNHLIPQGLDYGVNLMRSGEKYRFYIPSHLAYDNYGNTDFFDANSIFIIETEVADVQSADEVNSAELDSIERYIARESLQNVEAFSSGLHYKTLEPGEGDTPNEFSLVAINFVRKYLDGTVIESTGNDPVTLQLSAGQAVEGLEEGLLQMKEGEKALLMMPSDIAFGTSLQVLPTSLRDDLVKENIINAKVEPFSPVMYEVELVEVN